MVERLRVRAKFQISEMTLRAGATLGDCTEGQPNTSDSRLERLQVLVASG